MQSQLWIPVLTGKSAIQVLHLRLRDHDRKEGGNIIKTREQEICCEIVSLANVKEDSPMKSYQHDCLSKTWTVMRAIAMLIEMESQTQTKNYRQLRKVEWEKYYSPGKEMWFGSENMYTEVIYRVNSLYLSIQE